VVSSGGLLRRFPQTAHSGGASALPPQAEPSAPLREFYLAILRAALRSADGRDAADDALDAAVAAATLRERPADAEPAAAVRGLAAKLEGLAVGDAGVGGRVGAPGVSSV
jgi:hypothetical protein